MSTDTTAFDLISDRYLAFMSDPTAPSEVHIVLTATDPDVMLRQHKVFADFLATKADMPALVLHPRRFGSAHMADRYATITQTQLGQEIGLAGIRGPNRESYYHGHRHRVLIANYGHALNQHRIVHTYNVIVMCNTQEQTLPATLVKAAIKLRLDKGERLFIVVMTTSRTQYELDQQYFSAGSHDVLVMPSIVGDSVAPDQGACYLQPDDTLIESAILQLRTGQVKRGMVVCVADQVAANKFEKQLKDAFAGENWSHLELVTIHNRTEINVLRKVHAPPAEGVIRIIINIWALESSWIRINWVDVILSDGKRKEYAYTSMSGGSEAVLVDAAAPHIAAQRQISGWTTPATYILCSLHGYMDRAAVVAADVDLLPHTDAILQALEAGIDPAALTYDGRGIDAAAMSAATMRLFDLGLVTVTTDPHPSITLTEDGFRTRPLQIGVISKALLLAAVKLGIVDKAIPLIATIEAGGMRRVRMTPHDKDTGSDLFDAAMAFAEALKAFELPVPARMKIFQQRNISMRKVQTAQRVATMLSEFMDVAADYRPYLENGGVGISQPELRQKLKAALFVSGIEGVFRSDYIDNKRGRFWRNAEDACYAIGNASVLANMSVNDSRSVITGQLRDVTTNPPKTGKEEPKRRTFTIIENATAFTDGDLKLVAELFPTHLKSSPTDKSGKTVVLHRGKFWLTQVKVNKPVEAVIHQKAPIVQELSDPKLSAVQSQAIELEVIANPSVESTDPQPVQPSVANAPASVAPAKTVTRSSAKPAAAKTETASPVNQMMTTMVENLAERWGGNITSRR